ncbi:MAG: GNAT family N-acetyltransferase [Solirubrobacteraceae bacterium]
MGPIPLPDPALADGDLALRPWRPEDVPALVAACKDPEIPRWTLVPSPYSEDDARLWLAAQSAARRGGRRVELAIVDLDDRLLGSIAIARSADGRVGEVGYWVAAEARRRGVATRSVQLLAEWAFDELGLERIELLTEPENRASQRVAEAAGFTRERLLRAHREQKGTLRDFYLYALTPGDRP